MRRENRNVPDSPDLSPTIPEIGDIYYFEFSQVGKIWDGQESVKSSIVWDFPDMKTRLSKPVIALNCAQWSETPRKSN